MNKIDPVEDYKKFNSKYKKWMAHSGLLPIRNPSISYRLIPLFMTIVNTIEAFAVFTFCVFHASDLDEMTKSAGLFISLIATGLKIGLLIYYWDDMIELHETLDQISKEVLQDSEGRPIFLKKFATVRGLASFMANMSGIAITFMAVRPVVTMSAQLIHKVPVIWDLPALAIYPWKVTGGSPYYYCNYAFELVVGYIVLCLVYTFDAYFPIYISQLAGQFEVIAHQLNNMKKDDNYNENIRTCAKRHRTLLRCRDVIESVYSPVIAWMLLTTAVVLCALTFQLTKFEEPDVAVILQDFTYMTSKLVQIFIYAWSGTIVTTSSEVFAAAVYASNWQDIGRRNVKAPMMIMLLQKPLTITVLKYWDVSVEMFSQVLNTTMSYYLMLKTVDDK